METPRSQMFESHPDHHGDPVTETLRNQALFNRHGQQVAASPKTALGPIPKLCVVIDHQTHRPIRVKATYVTRGAGFPIYVTLVLPEQWRGIYQTGEELEKVLNEPAINMLANTILDLLRQNAEAQIRVIEQFVMKG